MSGDGVHRLRACGSGESSPTEPARVRLVPGTRHRRPIKLLAFNNLSVLVHTQFVTSKQLVNSALVVTPTALVVVGIQPKKVLNLSLLSRGSIEKRTGDRQRETDRQ